MTGQRPSTRFCASAPISVWTIVRAYPLSLCCTLTICRRQPRRASRSGFSTGRVIYSRGLRRVHPVPAYRQTAPPVHSPSQGRPNLHRCITKCEHRLWSVPALYLYSTMSNNMPLLIDLAKARLTSFEAALTIIKLSANIYPPTSWASAEASASEEEFTEEWALRWGISNWAWRTVSALKDGQDECWCFLFSASFVFC